jgi:hypothetical protein
MKPIEPKITLPQEWKLAQDESLKNQSILEDHETILGHINSRVDRALKELGCAIKYLEGSGYYHLEVLDNLKASVGSVVEEFSNVRITYEHDFKRPTSPHVEQSIPTHENF